jgi:diaminopimelate epimerase
MPIEFHKMHGAGNDFVLVDARITPFGLDPAGAARIADRRLGVGCDQILILRASDRAGCLLRYEIWNADGSQAAQCGNGARCVALYLERRGVSLQKPLQVESPAGPVALVRCPDGDFEVTMGVPEFDPGRIPVCLPEDGWHYRLDSPWGPLELGAASMGNPHALLLVADIESDTIPGIGRYIDSHEAFPEGCNVGFAQLEGPSRIRLRVIERGAGETLACGSGACAAMAILRRWGRVGDRLEVALRGGRLVIKWPGGDEPLIMKGPATHVFRGTMDE